MPLAPTWEDKVDGRHVIGSSDRTDLDLPPPGQRQDLLIRGPGEFLGARQSGVPLLRFADLERDAALIEQARDTADELLRTDPEAAAAHLDRWLGGREEFIKA